MSNVAKYRVGDPVTIISENKNRNLSSFIYNVYQAGPESNVVYLVSTGFGSHVDIDEFYEDDLRAGGFTSPPRSPRETLSLFSGRPDLVNVNCTITGRPRDYVLSIGMRSEDIYRPVATKGRRAPSNYNELDDEYSKTSPIPTIPPVAIKSKDGLEVGKPVVLKSSGEIALIREISSDGQTFRLTLKVGIGVLFGRKQIEPYNSSPKEVVFKKDDLLEVINQDKSAEEIILDLMDHLTN